MLKSDSPLTHPNLTDDVHFANPIEVAEAIDSLSATEHKKLALIARYFWKLRKLEREWVEAEDLLLEAITRTLAGERRWRKGVVSIVKHLDRVMESISGHWVEQSATYRQALEEAHSLSAIQAATRPMPENQLHARDQLEALEALFAGDPIALTVLWSRAEGRTAPEIKSQLGLSDRSYQTISKRIRRRLIQFSNQAESENDS